MARNMVVALGRAAVDGRALFGHNCARPAAEEQFLLRLPGRSFASGEKVRTPNLELPQVRQTCTTLGSRAQGMWGYHHGVNEHGVAIGSATLATRLPCDRPSLLGPDLVRLGLERTASARQAVDLLTDLISRHGQAAALGGTAADHGDNAFLIADAVEAFAVEACGSHWVYQEIQQVRAVSDGCAIRQDWDRIAPGLAGHAIARGWWPDDGSKLDFAAAVGVESPADAAALRRWGRATLFLEEQNGHIDTAFVRRLLSDHYEGTDDEVDPLRPGLGPSPICQHETARNASATAVSLVAQLGSPPVAWCAFGPPCVSVYLPVLLEGELPGVLGEQGQGPAARSVWGRMRQLHASLRSDAGSWARTRSALGQLQARLDQETEDFLAEAAVQRTRGGPAEFQRLAGLFMQHAVERFEAVVEGLLDSLPRTAAAERDRVAAVAAPARSSFYSEADG